MTFSRQISDVKVKKKEQTLAGSSASAASSALSSSLSSSVAQPTTAQAGAHAQATQHAAPTRSAPPLTLDQSDQMFLQQMALQRVTTYDGNTWEYFDTGKSALHPSLPPLVCLPSANATPRCFHLQMTQLAHKGYRVVAVQYPAIWTHDEWVHAFDRFLDTLAFQQIHVYGVGLGAYLAQRYCALYPRRVLSLALTQGFCDTTNFFGSSTPYTRMIPMLPEFYLKKFFLEKMFPQAQQRSPQMVEAIDYMITQFDSLSQQQLASRLTLMALNSDPNSWQLDLAQDHISLIDSYEDTTLPSHVRDQISQRYPQAKKAMIKQNSAFPFLSHHDEVTMLLHVHLRTNGLFIA